MEEAFDFRAHWEKAFLWSLRLPATLTMDDIHAGAHWLEDWAHELPETCNCHRHYIEATKTSPVPWTKGGGWVHWWLITLKDSVNRLLNKPLWFPGSKGHILVVMADLKMRAGQNGTVSCCEKQTGVNKPSNASITPTV